MPDSDRVKSSMVECSSDWVAKPEEDLLEEAIRHLILSMAAEGGMKN
jgi:hypothetical protein